MKLSKWAGALGILVLILAVAVVVLLGRLNALIEAGVAETGPHITGTPVNLAKADVSIFSGEGVLNALTIENPEGFSSESAFSLSEVKLAIEPKSLAEDVIVIRELSIDGAQLTAELSADGRSNLKIIMDHIKQLASAGSAPGDAQSGAEAGSDKKLMIEHFSFTNTQLHALAPALDLDKSLTIPDIHLQNIGTPTQGLSTAELSELLMQPVIAAAIDETRDDFIAAKAKELTEKGLEKLKSLF